MTRAIRLLAGAFGLVVFLCLSLAGIAAFLMLTDTGKSFVAGRTQAALSQLLGPDYKAELGAQTFLSGPDGMMQIVWRDVALQHVDRPEAQTRIDRLSLGLRLFPLVGGGLEFGRLEIEGARIDLSAFLGQPARRRLPERQDGDIPQDGASRSWLASTAQGAIGALERQIGALRAFHFETVAFSNISVTGLPTILEDLGETSLAKAELRRSGDGSLDLQAELTAGGLPLSLSGEAAFDETDHSLDRLSLHSGAIDFASISPPSPTDRPDEEKRFASDADFSLAFEVARDAASGDLYSTATIRGGAGTVQLGRNRTWMEQAELRFQYRAGEDRVLLLPSPVRFDGVAFDAQGTMDARPLDGGGSDAIEFRLRSENIESSIGKTAAEDPLAAELQLAGTFVPSQRELRLSALEVVTGEERLQGEGVLRYGAPHFKSIFTASARALSVGTVKALWPFNISGRARRWVLDHVGGEGMVRDAAVRVDLRRDRFGPAFGRGGQPEARELSIDLAFDGASSSTLSRLPSVIDADGQLRTEGSTTSILLDRADVEGYPQVSLSNSAIVLARPEDGSPLNLGIDLSLGAAGPVAELLAIADAEPIRALRSVELDRHAFNGTGNGRASVQLRIGPNIAPAETLRAWRVEAEMVGASPGQLIEGRQFTNLTGRLEVDRMGLAAELAGEMDEIPADMTLFLPFGAPPRPERTVDIELDLTSARLASLAPVLDGVVEGPLPVSLRQTEAGIETRIDLTRADLRIPTIAWRKGSGVESSLQMVLTSADGATSLQDIRLEGAGFSAAGSGVIDAQGLRSARLDRVSLNPGDDVAVAVDRTANGFSMTIEGQQFDARPLLQELKATAGQERPRSSSRQAFDLDATIARVRGFGEEVMSGFTLNLASDEGRLAALSLSGGAGGGAFRADLIPQGSEQSIRIASQNLGSLVAFTGLYENIEGGRADLDLLGTSDAGYRGQLRMVDFTIVDEPRLESLVGSQSVPGSASLSQAIGRDLRTSRAYFDQASANLSYADGSLRVQNGILRGPIFGSSFEGTLYDRQSRIDITGSFMPAYGLNRIFGALPLVGQILGNGDEGGLLGITYQLSGAFAAPSLTVNPISIIAPGIFRQIFEY